VAPAAGAGAVLAVRVCPADVGRRVTLRHRLPDDPRLSDLVGTLRSWDGPDADAVLLVQRRDGRSSRVQLRDLVAARVVRPEVGAYDAQAVAEQGWPPALSRPLGDWVLRWTHGVTGRANSVRVGGDPPGPLEAALAEVGDWYAAFGSPPLLQLPSPWTYDSTLDALGWTVRRRTAVLTAPVPAVAAAPVPEGVVVTSVDGPDDAWLATLRDEPRATWPVLREILTGPSPVVFLAARDCASDELLGVGRASVGTERGSGQRWCGLTSIETVPAARRRGIARAIVGELVRWAGEQGAGTVYLQVLTRNEPAMSLYAGMGFALHHAYVYRGPADPPHGTVSAAQV
jgi:GNAT superfamily N-acetyltransferase